MENWDAVGAIGEVLGAIGMVVSIGYLAVQIRRNTKAVQGNTLHAIAETHQFELHWSHEIAEIWVKTMQDPTSLSPAEDHSMSSWLLAAFTARQNEFVQYRRGLIDEDAWRTYESIMSSGLLISPYIQGWWKVSHQFFQPEFVSHVDVLLARISASQIGVELAERWLRRRDAIPSSQRDLPAAD